MPPRHQDTKNAQSIEKVFVFADCFQMRAKNFFVKPRPTGSSGRASCLSVFVA